MRALVNSDGAITEVWHYDSWGNILSMPAQRIEQPFLWNGAYGYEYIPFTGLYHVSAREYDPRTTRWLQRDPIGIGGGNANLYLYCLNNPLVSADPSGLQSDDLYDNPIDEEGRPIFYKKTYTQAIGEVNKRVLQPMKVGAETLLAINPLNDVANVCESPDIGKKVLGLIGLLLLAVPFDEAVRMAGLKLPELGRKLDFMFGKATGSAHNVQRSRDMLRQLQRIGLHDTPANRAYIEEHLTMVLNDPNNIVAVRNGRTIRESLLMGPNGGCKLQTIWEGSKLLTVYIFGGGQ